MPVITKPNQHFDAVTYTGAGGTQTVSGLQFQPDFIWGKARSAAYGSALFDSVRGYGSTKGLVSNLAQAEGTVSAQYGFVSAATSTGFTAAAGNDGSNPNAALNESGVTYVAWNWKAGGTAVTNTSGSISSQVSVNTTAGFSIVTYTGNATNGATVGHGLGVAPAMIIVKDRVNAYNWTVYHKNLTSAEYVLLLNSTSGQISSSAQFNSTAPTSSVFTLGWPGSDNNTNATTAHVAYCFAQISGYSAFGSYTGNGSTDGPFIYTGFRPRFVMFKYPSDGNNWEIFDAARNSYNQMDLLLLPSASSAESNAYGSYYIDFVSNGFKLRGSGGGFNGSGEGVIYAAFAEAPFKYANAR